MITYKETEKDVISKFEIDGDTTTQTILRGTELEKFLESGIEYEPYVEPTPDDATIALEYLSSTDWYVTRMAETGKEIPQDVLDKRKFARAVL